MNAKSRKILLIKLGSRNFRNLSEWFKEFLLTCIMGMSKKTRKLASFSKTCS